MQEAEYKHHFDMITNQITGATSAFYSYREIHKFASEGPENYNKINRDGYFWSGQLYALQTALFIILGRIFDRTNDGYSIHDFLKWTVEYKGFFSKRALAERKRRTAGRAEPQWLEDYLKSAWEPTRADLEKIRSAIEPPDAKWKTVYKPIRDNVFAHNNRKAVIDDLFRNTLVGDVEDILHDLNKIRIAIFQLFENGREYWITDDERSYADPFIADVRTMLSHLS
jgi:hypothetical protein